MGPDPESDEERQWMSIHVTCTKIFVIGQVIYLFIWVSILNNNPDRFKGSEKAISVMNFVRTTVVAFGLFTVLNPYVFNIPGKWDAFLEWWAFMNTFVAYMAMINIMPFEDNFKFKDE